MPRTCSICAHPERDALDAALVSPEPYRHIAARFRVTTQALQRHRGDHLPASLVRAEQAREVASATGVMAELERCFARVNLLFDACDRWLRDADDPSRYDLGPRSEDVRVTYQELGRDGKTSRRKERLSVLLARIEEKARGVTIEAAESRHADPRELILKTAAQLQGQTELLAKLVGELNEAPTVNVLVAPEWVAVRTTLLATLGPFPEARAAVAGALQTLEASNGHRG